MPVLALDTSSAISVSIVEGDVVLAHAAEYSPRGHAELLGAMVARCLEESGVAGASIDYVVVGTGPAPYTGLRVGIVTARTLALAWGVPVHGVCSLDGVGASHPGIVTVLADARRKELYWATYEDGRRISGPGVAKPDDVVLHGTAVGRGALLYPESFPGAVDGDCDPAVLARVVAQQRESGNSDLPTEPLYLRRPDVDNQAPRA